MPRHPSLGKRLRRQSGSILPILAGHAIAEATGRSSPDSRIGDDVTGDEQQRATTAPPPTPDWKSVVEGKSVSVRVDLGGRRSIKKKKKQQKRTKRENKQKRT